MADYDVQSFYDGLVEHGLIVPVAVQGAFGRGAAFEDVLERFNGLATPSSPRKTAREVYTFPPVIDRTIIEKTDYLDSFPQLAGTVFSFLGKEKEARALSERVHAGQPWGDTQGMTQVCLNPAACYPVYPIIAGVLPPKGRLITMTNWVYRTSLRRSRRGCSRSACASSSAQALRRRASTGATCGSREGSSS